MKEKVRALAREFKTFIERGNVVDLAVGVVIGTAFSKIVSSLVNDLLMPIIGIILGGLDFSSLSLRIGNATISYGTFINNVIDFFIIAVCVFVFVKIINTFMKKKEAQIPEEKPKKSEEVLLLEEIRDLLKDSKKSKKK